MLPNQDPNSAVLIHTMLQYNDGLQSPDLHWYHIRESYARELQITSAKVDSMVLNARLSTGQRQDHY